MTAKKRRPPPTRRSPTPGRVPPTKRRGARTTGRLGAPDPNRPKPNRNKGLGGEQVEGRQAVRELLIAGARRVHEVWIATESDDRPILDDIAELAQSQRVMVREVGRSKLAAEARTEAPQGVLARAASLPEHTLEELMAPYEGRTPFLLAVDGVTDPGNLGALLRTAEAAGVTGVLLPRHRAVHVTASVAKAAAGAIEHLRLGVVGGLPATLLTLRQGGIWVLGLDAGGSRSLFDGLPTASEAVCLVLGAEGTGLSRLVRQRCDELLAIPLQGRLGSLNVAAAGALALYEIARTRR